MAEVKSLDLGREGIPPTLEMVIQLEIQWPIDDGPQMMKEEKKQKKMKAIKDPCAACNFSDLCTPLDGCGMHLHALDYPEKPHPEWDKFYDLATFIDYKKEMGYD